MGEVMTSLEKQLAKANRAKAKLRSDLLLVRTELLTTAHALRQALTKIKDLESRLRAARKEIASLKKKNKENQDDGA